MTDSFLASKLSARAADEAEYRMGQGRAPHRQNFKPSAFTKAFSQRLRVKAEQPRGALECFQKHCQRELFLPKLKGIWDALLGSTTR